MTQYAYIRDGVVSHVSGSDKEEMAGLQSVVALPATHTVRVGDSYNGDGVFCATATTLAQNVLVLTPTQFKLCFTVQERVLINRAKKTDEVVIVAFEILDDPKLEEVHLDKSCTIDVIDYLVSINCITRERGEDVKLGKQI